MCEEGIVFFYDNTKKTRFTSKRFSVGLNIPDASKIYFNPLSFWTNLELENIENNQNNEITSSWISSSYLGEVEHGIQTNNAPGTKSMLFSPPFFLVFKTQALTSNYLSFIDFQKPNSEATVLCMLQYDEEKNILDAEYTPELLLPYEGDLSLNDVLEFTLYDSKKKLVQVADTSQLFILLTLL
jgi:hypothetical protein